MARNCLITGRSAGAVVTLAEGEGRGYAVLLWADGTPAPDGSAYGPGGRFAVTAAMAAADPGRPRYAQFTVFDGPRTAEWVAALERAGAERIWPALRDVPGLAAGFTATAADGGTTHVSLAESREALGEAVRRIMATQLLDWERPEHLTGPDRVEVHRVLHAVLPEDVRSAS